MLRTGLLILFALVAAGFRSNVTAEESKAQPSHSKSPEFVFPIIAGYGGVVARPGAVEQPKAGAKVLFEITQDSKPTEVNKGLVRVARLLNVYGAAGLKATDINLVIVLHGDATKSILTDSGYEAQSGEAKNPNLPLVRALREAGVNVLVCGQALSNKKIADEQVAEGVSIAASATTAIINKQSEGYLVFLVP